MSLKCIPAGAVDKRQSCAHRAVRPVEPPPHTRGRCRSAFASGRPWCLRRQAPGIAAPCETAHAARLGAHGPAQRLRSAIVAETLITLRILRRGVRTDELLRDVERRVGGDRLRRDDFGAVEIRVRGRAAVTWDEVRDALDAAGSDWRQWIYLAPRP